MSKQATRTNQTDPAQFVIDNWRKGLDTLVTPSRLQLNESPDASNMVLTEDGIPTKIGGTAVIRDTKAYMPRVRGLASYYVTGATDYLFMVGATQVWYGSTATNAWLSVSGASISNDTTTNVVVAGGRLFLHNGKDPLQAVYNTGATNPAQGISAKFGLYWKGIHFAGGNATNQSRLYLARSSDPGYFISSGTDTLGFDAQWYDVSPNDGDKLTGLAVFRDNLIIFKERAIYRGVPTNATTGAFFSLIDVISKSVGCVSHRTIDAVDNDVYYLSRRGIMVLGNEPNFFDVIRTNEISAQIHDQIDGITPTNLGLTAGIHFGYRYRVAYPFGGTTYNNQEMIYDTRYGSWMVSRGININSYTSFVDPADSLYKLYAGDDTTGQVFQLDTGNSFNNVAITSYLKTAEVDGGHPELTKFWEDVDVQFKNTQATMKIDVYIDGEVYKSRTVAIGLSSASQGYGVNMFGDTMWGMDGTATNSLTSANPLFRIPTFKQGRNIAVKVTNTSTNETWTLLSVRGSYTPLSHYVFNSSNKL